MTQVIAIPLRDREADALRDQLAITPGVEQDRRTDRGLRRAARRGAHRCGGRRRVAAGRDPDPGGAGRGRPTTCCPGSSTWTTTDERPAADGDPHRGADQAVRADHRRGRGRPRRPRGRRLRLPRRQRLGQDDDGADAARAWCWPPPGRIEVLGEPMPRAARRVLPQVGALVEGPAAYPHLSGRRNLALFDAMGPGRRPARPARAGSPRRSSGSGSPPSTSDRSARTRSACGSGSGWPAPCCADPGCWCSTSRPTASTRRASRRSASCCSSSTGPARRSSCPATCSAEIEQMCTRVGVLDRGRLVLQAELAELRAPDRPGRGAHAGRRAGPASCSTGSWRSTTTSGCWSASRIPPRSTRGWCRPGIRVTRFGAERRTLEEVVLAATTDERRPVRPGRGAA